MSSDNGTPASPPASEPATPGTPPPNTPPSSRRALIVIGSIAGVVIVGLLVALVWALAARPASAPVAPSSASPTPSATPSAAPSARPTPSSTPTSTADAATCTVDELTLSLGASNGGAGSTVVPILFQNTGARDCQLEGYPGVSLVGDENGTQIGAAAAQDPSVPIEVFTLAPGDQVQALVTITNADNYDGCGTERADGFRVSPPHSFDAVFLPTTDYAPCTDEAVTLMRTTPVQAVGPVG